jgi:hypothetical protein
MAHRLSTNQHHRIFYGDYSIYDAMRNAIQEPLSFFKLSQMRKKTVLDFDQDASQVVEIGQGTVLEMISKTGLAGAEACPTYGKTLLQANRRRSVLFTGSRLSSRSPRRSTFGFTALEILVATVILTIIVGMLLAIFNKGSDTWLGGQRMVERLDRTRSTLERIRTDLSTTMISTSTPSIHFFGLSNQVFFISIAPTKDLSSDTGDEMEEVGYWLGSSGKLYRAFTPSTDVSGNYNPRYTNMVAGNIWKWPELTQTFFASNTEDVLVAEDVLDIRFLYQTATGLSTNWFTTNAPAGVFQTNTLPEMVDISLTVFPQGQWRAPNTPSASLYADFTNRHVKTFNSTVHLKRGGGQ